MLTEPVINVSPNFIVDVSVCPNEPVETEEPLIFAPRTTLPPSDISNVIAVLVTPSSLPLNTISLSAVADFITKSEDALLKLPNSVPPSFNTISVPSSSKIISPPESNVKSPTLVKEPFEISREPLTLKEPLT